MQLNYAGMLKPFKHSYLALSCFFLHRVSELVLLVYLNCIFVLVSLVKTDSNSCVSALPKGSPDVVVLQLTWVTYWCRHMTLMEISSQTLSLISESILISLRCGWTYCILSSGVAWKRHSWATSVVCAIEQINTIWNTRNGSCSIRSHRSYVLHCFIIWRICRSCSMRN